MGQIIVVKVGTTCLTQPQTGQLSLTTIAGLVETLCQLRQAGHRVILVTSGAVGIGCARLALAERPQSMALKQAIAAVGQGRLMRIYDDFFSSLQQPIAQILLTRGDLMDRYRFINASNTLNELLKLNIVPIVNENDTVAVDELKFGDNDRLSALVASLVQANWLCILTDVEYLYSANPKTDPEAQPIHLVESLAQLAITNVQTHDPGSRWGTGGMATKILAADIATSAGVRTVITHGRSPQNLLKIVAGEAIGTQFAAHPTPINARKHWIAHTLVPAGKLVLDDGAIRAITQLGRSLLPAGILTISGNFQAQQAVQICDAQDQEVARGLVNYSSQELHQIRGQRSEKIAQILGYADTDTVIHRDNLVLLR
ncbi:glutamate 5-kinase [Lyngbya confervoides]|uniref:Glutamate 5-kinase n=1 Tax=Lyngbya confervoides BDU141951 TaxID=1574623 RepID=A0ABD4SXS5_9CYAN|nr:glutamate 5-kinase [Lyngbya confervoides]MCM1981366.1 glutamate 5-kinase [Lyngbya confervoides BDU141951]